MRLVVFHTHKRQVTCGKKDMASNKYKLAASK